MADDAPVGFGNGGSALGAPSAAGADSLEGDGATTGAPAPADADATAEPAVPPTDLLGQGGAKLGTGEVEQEEGTGVGTAEPDGMTASPDSAMTAAAATDTPEDPAGAPTKPDVPDISGTGNFVETVKLDVPAFHGIEPNLALRYDSSRKTRRSGLYQGWLGYGWGFDGFDIIERVSQRNGVPRFDSTDKYQFNGNDLIACPSTTASASCSAGGTHTALNDDFRRYVYDGTSNQWTVTETDGTKMVFGARQWTNSKWLLYSVADTHNNLVTYTYACPDNGGCYPQTVAYNDITINFYLENRPDVLRMGNGEALTAITKRIKSIVITRDGINVAAYRLQYDQAPLSNASRLTIINRYGRDVTYDATGTITGGTSKKIRAFGYNGYAVSYGEKYAPTNYSLDDLNRDGKDEFFTIDELSRSSTSTRDSGVSWTISKGLRVIAYDINGNATTKQMVTDTKTSSDSSWDFPQTNIGFVGKFKAVGTKQMGAYNVTRTFFGTSGGGYYRYNVTPFVLNFSNDLDISRASCSSEPTICAELPQPATNSMSEPYYLRRNTIDRNGDGVDELGSLSHVDRYGDGAESYLQSKNTTASTLSSYISGAWTTLEINVNCENNACIRADFNGDGLTDIMRAQGSGKEIWYSYGAGFQQISLTESLTGTVIAADFDNDGTADIASGALTTGDPYGTLSIKSIRYPTATTSQIVSTSFSCSGSRTSGDFNGDGQPDFLISPNSVTISNASRSAVNLLSSMTVETGGTVSVSYTPSSVWPNKLLPFVMHTVTGVTVNDGRGNVGTTNYTYAGGYYYPPARKFLGYQTVTATKPPISGETLATAPKVITTYHQTLADYGLPDKTVYQNGDGSRSKTVDEGYTLIDNSLPYRALNTSTVTTLTENAAATLQVDRTFSTYGMITSIKDHGRTDVLGDEVWTSYGDAPNPTSYVVSLPSSKTVRSGFNPTDPILLEEKYAYDGKLFGEAPDKGDLTTLSRSKTATTDAVWTYEYDPATGNKLSEQSELGNRSEWSYNTKHQVIAERFPKYFKEGDTRFATSISYDPVCGLPSSKMDINSLTETWIYDAYCRVSNHTMAGTGELIRTVYENEGNPATQAVVTYRTPATGTTEVYERTFYDGLARPWKVASSGDDGVAERLTETAYDVRGNVWKTTAPYYATATAAWTVNSYDWADRLVKVTNPDTSFRTVSHSLSLSSLAAQLSAGCTSDVPLWSKDMKDEVGNGTREFTNTRDNLIYSYSYLASATSSRVCYQYDGVGRMTRIADDGGSVWNYSYDWTGNRLTAQDPDLGAWSYGYDDENRLVSQTDARGYVTTVVYDSMGRITKKTAKSPTNVTFTIVDNKYDENQDVGLHNVGSLSAAYTPNTYIAYKRRYTGDGYITRQDFSSGGTIHTIRTGWSRGGQTWYVGYPAAPVLNVGTDTQRWVYTTSNRLYSIPGYITAITYEADGNTKQIAYANGVTATFSYSPTRGWLTGLVVTKATGAILDLSYGRYADGRIQTITNNLSPGDVWTYTYDYAGQLTKASNPTQPSLSEDYVYAGNGNLLSRTRVAGAYVYPAASAAHPHSPDTIGSRVLSYDANGNLLGDGQRTLTWDAANRLVNVAQAGTTVSLGYAPDGSRVKKTSTAGANTLYPDPSIEMDQAAPGGAEIIRYPHPDLKIVQKVATAAVQKQYLHRDHLSSVRIVTDQAGNTVEQTGYSAYGEATNTSMATAKNYIGERFDPETGLMYLNARYYDPVFGRFVPADPAEQE